jgi:hypothetical protein
LHFDPDHPIARDLFGPACSSMTVLTTIYRADPLPAFPNRSPQRAIRARLMAWRDVAGAVAADPWRRFFQTQHLPEAPRRQPERCGAGRPGSEGVHTRAAPADIDPGPLLRVVKFVSGSGAPAAHGEPFDPLQAVRPVESRHSTMGPAGRSGLAGRDTTTST